jgi:protoheme IX farnesyltransferase
MPSLIGWSAATGEIELGALVLFGIAFLWQIPHVLSLAWLLREDYARVGFLMMPPADRQGRFVGAQMVLYSAALLSVSLFPTPLGLTGWVYLVGATILGSALLWWSISASRAMDRTAVRRVFLGSLAYQPLLLGLMLLDTVRS